MEVNELGINEVLGKLDFERLNLSLDNIEKVAGNIRTVYQQFSFDEIVAFLLTKVDVTSPEATFTQYDKLCNSITRLERRIERIGNDSVPQYEFDDLKYRFNCLSESIENWKMGVSLLYVITVLALVLSVIK